MSLDFIDKYFTNYAEFPERIAEDPLPLGTYWGYIGDTFLNAFINYVDVKAGYVLNRYYKWNNEDGPDLDYNHVVTVKDDSDLWVKFSGTKDEVYEKLCEKGRIFHPRLDCDFGDDLIILAKCRDASIWYLFWFDRDSSDCSIGRFESEVSEEVLLKDLKAWLEWEHFEYKPAKPIPLHYFETGWLQSR